MAKLDPTIDYKAATLPCEKCKGTGVSKAITREDGTELIPERPCPYCDGVGHFDLPDYPTIIKLIKGRKGLRSRRPDPDRAYYVWRMARFHGGADVTMPMTAAFAVSGDPYVPVLDALSELVAQKVYGTEAAGAIRWAHAMGHEVPEGYLKGQILPPSAQPGGPVVLDGDKPLCEVLELM